MYGSDFGIEFGRPDPDTFEIRVDRCFFRDFFDRHDARPVPNGAVRLGRELDAGARPRYYRPTVRAHLFGVAGDDACRFRVMRTDHRLAEHGDAFDRKFADDNQPTMSQL